MVTLERRPAGQVEVQTWLGEAGVPLARTKTAETPEEAGAAAAALGRFPVVLKAGGLLHKSDEGGVVLGLGDPDAVLAEARRLLDRLGARALPLLVQEQLTGREMLLGLRREAGLGALVLVGFGGTEAEVLADTARALVPVTADEARGTVSRLRGYPLLAGHRGEPPRDVAALCDLLVRVSRLAEARPDIVELDLNPVLVKGQGEGAVAVDARAAVAPPPPSSAGNRPDLRRLFDPRHVVVVGVSDDPGKIGSRIFGYLLGHGFGGRVDPVHPKGGTVLGRHRYRSLAEVGGSPDLVCVAVPSQHVDDVAREAVARNAGAVIVHSSGFAETGTEGRDREERLAEAMRDAGIPLLGPNCMGVLSPPTDLAASMSGGLEYPDLRAGPAAIVTSSGALASCLASRLLEAGIGLSRWIHLGNEADVDAADCLDWLADDPHTKVVGLLLENVADGARLVEAGRRVAAAGKPMFAYTMVRTDRGRAAALSHTGALVGSHELREDLLAAAGAVSVPTLRVLEDALALAATDGLPAGPRLVAVTASGGACSIIADAAEAAGIELPELPPRTREAVGALVPDFAAVRNPLDLSAQIISDASGFGATLDNLVDGGTYDAVLLQFTTNADPSAEIVAKAVVAARQRSPIPLYVSRFGAAALAPRGMAEYASAGIPVLDAPDRAMDAIAALVRARRQLDAREPSARVRSRRWTFA
ncbi:MAG: hypothetical protein GEV03_23320 [Streptosporangiales bacterium]|nr:hypothetical protein [Streptosporangiales bacterium]